MLRIGLISVLCVETWPFDIVYLFTGLFVFIAGVLDELNVKLGSL